MQKRMESNILHKERQSVIPSSETKPSISAELNIRKVNIFDSLLDKLDQTVQSGWKPLDFFGSTDFESAQEIKTGMIMKQGRFWKRIVCDSPCSDIEI